MGLAAILGTLVAVLALPRFGSCATHARALLPAALGSVSFGGVLVRARVRASKG